MPKLLYVLTFVCFMFGTAARAEAATVTLAWDPNSEVDLAGYTVLFGTQSGRYDRVIEVGKTTMWTFREAEVNKTYYFVVQAVNTSGVRSEFSQEVQTTVHDPGFQSPSEPGGPDPGTSPEDNPPEGSTRLSVNRTSLTFGAIAGTNGLRSAAQHASVTFSNGSSTWIAKSNVPWVQITREQGDGPGSFTVTLAPGTYAPTVATGTITVTAPTAWNTSVKIPITLRVVESGENPYGTIDTPADHATGIRGSIAITGWASDDVDVKEVMIYRDTVPGEAGGHVFVGRAVFVDGARPDVDAAIAQPFDYEAGWGYMLMTRMLPNGGNGTFTLRVYATDFEGHTVLLGSRTITCDNANAAKPFGAIDTPDQGGTASGTNYLNFGWALTPMPYSIPTDGSTILV